MSLSLPQILFPTIYKLTFYWRTIFLIFALSGREFFCNAFATVFCSLKGRKKKLTANHVSVVQDSENPKGWFKDLPPVFWFFFKKGFLTFAEEVLSVCLNYPCEFRSNYRKDTLLKYCLGIEINYKSEKCMFASL